MDENQPVDDSEFVYRRIHPKFYNAGSPVAILYEAFRPNRADDKGLSVLRARFAKPEACLANIDPAEVSAYTVAQLSVTALRTLGLTLHPDPLPDGPAGHANIEELNWSAYQANKQRWKPVLFELAKLASAAIVYPPPGS